MMVRVDNDGTDAVDDDDTGSSNGEGSDNGMVLVPKDEDSVDGWVAEMSDLSNSKRTSKI